MAEVTLLEAVPGIAAGGISALAVGAFSAVVAVRWRSRAFERHKRAGAELPPWFRKFDAPARGASEQQRDKAMREILATEHAKAKAFQDRAISHLIAASATLLAAFVVAALSLTVWAESALVHIGSAAFDIAALAIAYFCFLRSGRYRGQWLRQRAIAELLRQWLNVEYILAPKEPALTQRVEALIAAWDAAIDRRPAMLIESVATVAYARIDELTQALKGAKISNEALRTYYTARPQRQTRWFATSLERIEHGQRGRELFMIITFLGAAIGACVKLTALLLHRESLAEIAMLVLLICIGLAGASSSAYLGQNQRSLRHRYAEQLREIREWNDRSAEDGLVVLLSGERTASRVAIVRDVRAFERLMTIELLDWLAISTDDAMELAPS